MWIKNRWPQAFLIRILPLIGLLGSCIVAYLWIPLDSLFAAFPVIAILALSNFLSWWLAEIKRNTEVSTESQATPQTVHPDPPSLTRRDQDLGVLAAGIAHELGQPLSAARVDIEGLHL